MKNRVEADVFKSGGVSHRAQVVPVTLAEAQNGAPGAKRLFPKVRKRMLWRGSVYLNGFLRWSRAGDRFTGVALRG
jgi:hypothetical protein